MIALFKVFLAKYRLYVGAAVCLIMFSFGWYLHGIFYAAGRERELNAMISQHAEAERIANANSAKLEQDLANARKQNSIINEGIKDEIKKPAYNCIVPTTGRLLLRKAITSTSTS